MGQPAPMTAARGHPQQAPPIPPRASVPVKHLAALVRAEAERFVAQQKAPMANPGLSSAPELPTQTWLNSRARKQQDETPCLLIIAGSSQTTGAKLNQDYNVL